MGVDALALALAAAAVHALWNLALAREEDSEAATAVALPLGLLVLAPIAALTGGVSSAAIPWLLAHAVFHVGYFALLPAAYNRAELSVVYPLSRGFAPVIVLTVSVVALGVGLSVGEIAGVALVAVGIVLVRGLKGLGDPVDVAFSMGIAACIAGYTLVDKEGLRHADPLPYLALGVTAPAVLYPLWLIRSRGAAALRPALRPLTAFIGVGMMGAYTLVLFALRLAPAAPVAAVRETSVVMATAFAAGFLGEKVDAERMLGAVVVVAGVAAIALG